MIKSNDKAFALKGSSLPLTVMHLYKTDIHSIQKELTQGINKAPGLFKDSPMVIDLASLPSDSVPNFSEIDSLLRDNGIIPIGVQNCPERLSDLIVKAKLTPLPKGKDHNSFSQEESKPAKTFGSKLINRSLRSGQRVYAPGSDLTIIGSVSPGAEAIADGNIHIYGALKGRALAGASGDENTRIFCLEFDAELASVAGSYRLFEQSEPSPNPQPTQIYLEEGRIIVGLFRE